MGLIRLALFAGAILLIYFLVKKLVTPSDYKRCGKCEGKGYWIALRGRETCDVCKGAGRILRQA